MGATEEKEEKGCGLGGWRPEFLQKFADTKTFMFVYGLLGTIQAMSFVYFVSTLTSLEKRFRIPSRVTGILMSGNEVSQILLSMYLSYRGGKGNRPLWMAWGVLFSSLSCFILAVPHSIYGPGRDALALTREHLDYRVLASTQHQKPSHSSEGDREGKLFLCSANRTQQQQQEGCDEADLENSFVPLVLIFLSQFVLGIGTTLYVTLGQPYLDDNTKKKNTPMLLGITMALRTAGPAAGFVLGYLCLSLYVNPYLTPVIDRNDPRWIGAWWLGWIILGSIMTVFSLLLALFPKKLPKKNCIRGSLEKKKKKWDGDVEVAEFIKVMEPEESVPDNEEVGFKDFRKAVKRILRNPLLLSNNFAAVFYILALAGYFSFYSKYLESQFHTSAASASMFAGVTTVLSMVVGFVTAGVAISKVRPRTSYLLAWNVVVGLAYIAGEILLIFVGCEDEEMPSARAHHPPRMSDLTCDANCSCESVAYAPVCYEDWSRTFPSPCNAGCLQLLDSRGKKTYGNCSCLPEESDVVHQGACHVDCFGRLLLFVGIQCLIQLIGCSGRITTVLVNYRSIRPRDKELAQGLALFMVSLLAFIPGPIIYGKIIDSACIIWDNSCGNRGNCWLYDKWTFRLNLNLTSICFTSIAVIFDGVVWYLGRNLKLYDDPTEAEDSRP